MNISYYQRPFPYSIIDDFFDTEMLKKVTKHTILLVHPQLILLGIGILMTHCNFLNLFQKKTHQL